jgi:hypothetical protein
VGVSIETSDPQQRVQYECSAVKTPACNETQIGIVNDILPGVNAGVSSR